MPKNYLINLTKKSFSDVCLEQDYISLQWMETWDEFLKRNKWSTSDVIVWPLESQSSCIVLQCPPNKKISIICNDRKFSNCIRFIVQNNL